MTPAMLEALRRSENGPLTRVHDDEKGKPPWPAPASSLAALVKHGMLERSSRISSKGKRIDEWHATELGIEALKAPARVKRDAVRSLRVPGGSTRFLQHGVWVERSTPEPEPVSAADLDAAWFGEAARRHASERDRQRWAREIANRRKAA